jgi:hypothetical protein
MDGPKRDYLYVSAGKVNKFWAQIEKQRKYKYEKRLGLKVGVLSADVTQTDADNDNRYHRLAVVEEWMRATKHLGKKDSGASWLEDEATVSSAVFPQKENVMFFFANSDRLFFGLAGAAGNMMGNTHPASAHSSVTHLPRLLERLRLAVERQTAYLDNADKSISDFLNDGVTPSGKTTPWTTILAEIASWTDGNPKQKISFLARSLTTEVFEGKRWTLATPLYIALDDAGWARPESS